MRCPKCGFISFDRPGNCGKCGRDLEAVAAELGGTVFPGEAPAFLATALAAAEETADNAVTTSIFNDDQEESLDLSEPEPPEPEAELAYSLEPESESEPEAELEPAPAAEAAPTAPEPAASGPEPTAADLPDLSSADLATEQSAAAGEPAMDLGLASSSPVAEPLDPAADSPPADSDTAAAETMLDLDDLTANPESGAEPFTLEDDHGSAIQDIDDLLGDPASSPMPAATSGENEAAAAQELVLSLDDDTPLGVAAENDRQTPEIPDLDLSLESEEEPPKTS